MVLAALLVLAIGGEPVERDPERGVVLLKLAQEARREGRTEQALGDLELAIAADPELAAAYLTRAQLIVDMAGDLEAPPEDAEARREWVARLEIAVADLETYALLTDAAPEVAETIERERTRLFEAIVAAKSEAEPEPEPEPERESVPVPLPEPAPKVRDLVDRKPRTRAGPALIGTGIAASGAAIGLLSLGLQIDRTCGELCSVRWDQRAGLLGGGVSAAVLGATLLTIGAVDLSRNGADSLRARRVRKSSGIALVSLGGAASIGTAVLAGLASARWGSVTPSDTAGLGRTQALANASLALGSTIPALLGSGIALLVRRARA